MAITSLADQLKRDEGLRKFPYKDTVGKSTIGYGRNLEDVGISEAEAETLLANDIAIATSQLEFHFPWTMSLDEARKGVLVNMAFNMGVAGVAQFRDTLAKIQAGEYSAAAQAMLQSKWAEQVGARAQRLSVQMESGIWQ
jgi:lysozyme